MPGRTRRVRLLAITVCIFTVFFLYARNEARVGEYADYIKATAVGGGAVLRPEQQDKQAPLPPLPQLPQAQEQEDIKPASKPEPVAEPAPTTSSAVVESESSTTTFAPTRTTQEALKEQSTSTSISVPYLDDFDSVDLPIEIGQNPLKGDTWEFERYQKTTTQDVHWTKQPEHFPISTTIQLPTGKPSAIPLIQKQGKGKGKADKERLAVIKEAAQWAWNGFAENAWGYDEVRPVAGNGKNTFNGWGATLVDSLDTLWIMGMTEEFEQAVNKTAEIDFTTSSRNDIPLFEVTIRYLGGLIAAYDVSGKKYKVLLEKAVELGEILYSAFDTPNRIPETYYHWKPAFARNAHRASTKAVMSELGSLSLEFTRLSQLTLEPKYYDAIARITDEFEQWQDNTRLPGMWPLFLDASGCRAPEYVAPSRTNNNVPALKGDSYSVNKAPVPDGETYMMTSEPVKADKVVSAAENAVKNGVNTQSQVKNQPKVAGPAQDKMGSVANPAPNNAMAGVLNSMASLRHSMEEHPSNGKESYSTSNGPAEDVTNHGKAKEPLKPDAGAANDQVTSTDRLGHADPLPPNAGKTKNVAKRQLEDFSRPAGSGEATSRGNSTVKLGAPKESETPQCIVQGFASTTKNGQESFNLGAMSDSTYEYLPKEYLLLGGRVEQYKDMYLASMETVIDKLLFKPMTPDQDLDILISGEIIASVNYTTREVELSHNPVGEHLTCFVGGMFSMGGKIFSLPEHVEIGRKLTAGCYWAYASTASGIMPEKFLAATCADSKDLKKCEWNETRYHELLDPSSAFREEQRASYKKQYQIEDLEAYEEQLAASSLAAAAAATARATASTTASTAASTTSSSKADVETLFKRQTMDELVPVDHELDSVAAPQPASAPRPSAFNKPEPEFEVYTPPPRPVYTPPPPPTHEQYVMNKIHDDRLPPGFVSMHSRKYILRPEAIESVFYMYRITGEQQWRDMGWEMFTAVERATRAPYGHSALDDITREHPGQTDAMESFWIAETLKYYYLLFDDPDRWSLDDWVLNTEAHPFRRPENPTKS